MRNNQELSYECIRRNVTIKLDRCLVCDSNNTEDAYTEYPLGIVRKNEILLGRRTVSVCKNCGIAYSSEIIPREAMEPIYTVGASGDILMQKGTNRNWFKLLEDRRDFALHNFNEDPPAKAEDKAKYDVCDVGCSGGAFLSLFDSSKWNLFGVDASPRATKECMSRLNAEVDTGYWEDMQANEEKFDLVVSTHVLEHCYSPITFLQNCQKALRKNGYLFMEVPDTTHAEWWSLLPYNPTHVIHFSLETLVYMVESVGLTPIRWETAYPPQDSGLKDAVLRVMAKKTSPVRQSKIVVDSNNYINVIREKRAKTIKFSQIVGMLQRTL